MRYQNSFLGILWVLIKPYATFLVMYLVWTRIIDNSIPNFAQYLLIGIVFYNFFNELILLGQNALLEKAHIILKVNFSRQVVILSSLITALINFLINLILVIIILIISDFTLRLDLFIYFLFVVLVTFLFGLGISLYSSVLTIRFRDLKNIFELGLFLLYWVTPIFYTLDSNFISDKFASIIGLNPLGIIIDQARFGMGVYGEFDTRILLVFALSLTLVVSGWFYFRSQVRKIAELF